MASSSTTRPNFSQGWGMAGFITALAIGSYLLAGYIKQSTYHSPNDPTAPSAGGAAHEAAPAAAGEAH